ncbi:MAG: ketoacid CoA transferase, partial [Pseudomonadota bacterium]|nr:ketoacid CoA transferase [Pseudomonadota bacterium]
MLATGIGLLPRIAVGLAKKLHNPDLMMTDGEAFLIDQPHPLGVGAEPCV